jgi:carboxyl-terminal processing protease
MKITVAKYYIPSGRCIQAIDYSMKDEDGYFTKIPDSLLNEFQTKNGRIVYDGGGIEPDVYMEPLKYSQILMSLFTKFLIFDYATQFMLSEDEIASPEDFYISDEVYAEFIEFLADKDYDYTTRGEKSLEDFKKAAMAEGYFDAISGQYEKLKEAMIHNKEEDLITYQEEIKNLLKMEIVSRYYYQEGKIRAALNSDPEVKRATEILEDPALYQSILDGSYIQDKAASEETDDKDQG